MNFIYQVKNAYSLESCNKLIRFFEDNINQAKPGKTGEENLNDLEIELEINHLDSYYGLGKTLNDSIIKFRNNYQLVDTCLRPWSVDKFCQLMKYEPDNYYDVIHCENDGHPEDLNRVFAWMIYLNSISEGGGTYFIYQNTIIEPIAGDFYIWPAHWTHFHRGVNAPNETKYIITGWVNFDYTEES